MRRDLQRQLSQLEFRSRGDQGTDLRQGFETLLDEAMEEQGVSLEELTRNGAVVIDDPYYLNALKAIVAATQRFQLDNPRLPSGFSLIEWADESS